MSAGSSETPTSARSSTAKDGDTRERDRIRSLKELCIIGTPPDPALDRICKFASELLEVPMVALTLLDEDTQWLQNKSGLDLERTSRGDAFCNYAILQEGPLIVEDAGADPRFRRSRLVTGELGIRFYAGMPLALEPGIPIATLCCFDTKPRRFTEHDRMMLADLGSIALSQIKLHKAGLDLHVTAQVDALTGLRNRRALCGELAQAISRAVSTGRGVALVLMDLDHFKQINDARGHGPADAMLREAARRVSAELPLPSAAGRTGSDEFAAVVPGNQDLLEFERLAARLLQALRRPYDLDGDALSCTASIGIAIAPAHATDVEQLFQKADLALYAAKQAGGDVARLFSSDMQDRFEARMGMLTRARRAISDRSIVPFYQPKIALGTGRIVGFEALLRVDGPNGIEPPAVIKDAFEEPKLASELGMIMLDRVAEDMRNWSTAGVQFSSVALNVTERELCSDLPERLFRKLAENRLPPSALQVEVTENVFLSDDTGCIDKALEQLRAGGIENALDDFGTGYASLTHLRRFPVNWLKLDRSFVGKLGSEWETDAIVRGVIDLAHSLGIGVVAEGVESQAQLQFLRRHHCDLGQGFLFAKPMPASRVPGFIKGWAWNHELRRPVSSVLQNFLKRR